MTISDDEWLAAARARAASGEWERPGGVILADLEKHAAVLTDTKPALPRCPYCTHHPELLRFQRFELQTIDPLYFCGACYGFWAKGDSLARGVADSGYTHPALDAAPPPRRCRACFGHLKPDNTCAKCGLPLPGLECPACSQLMERFEREGAILDQCKSCRGVWFDMGEIARVYKLQPAQGLAASTVDEHACDDEPSGWEIAFHFAARLVFPFLPF